MTLVEDFSVPALSEVVTVLRERLRRCGGSCQISDRSIRRMIEDRFGLNAFEARWIRDYVVSFLVRRRGLVFVQYQGTRAGNIYDVNGSGLIL